DFGQRRRENGFETIALALGRRRLGVYCRLGAAAIRKAAVTCLCSRTNRETARASILREFTDAGGRSLGGFALSPSQHSITSDSECAPLRTRPRTGSAVRAPRRLSGA